MNRKQLFLLLAFVAVVGGAGLLLLNHHHDSWTAPEAKMGEKVMPDFQPNAIAAIHIKGASELDVVRDNDVWRVKQRENYPANFHLISDMLLKLRDLKIVQSESIGASQLGRVNLAEPGQGNESGTLVEFKDGQGKVLNSLLLGKMHIRQAGESTPSPFGGVGSPDGRYLLVPADPQNVLLVSNALSSFTPDPRNWLSRDFIKVEKLKSVSFQPSNDAVAWKIFRESESAPWQIAGLKPGETLDQMKCSRMAEQMKSLQFSDVLPMSNAAPTGLDKPLLVILETFDRLIYTLKIGALAGKDDRYFAVAVAGDSSPTPSEKLKREQAFAPWVYVVSSWSLQPITVERVQLLKVAEQPPSNSVPADIAPLQIK